MEKRTGSQKLNCPVRCSEGLNWDSHPLPHSPSREWELSTSLLAQGSLPPSQIGTHPSLKRQDFSVFIQASKKTAKLDLLIYYLLCQKQCCTISGVLCLIESLLLSFWNYYLPVGPELWEVYYWIWEPQHSPLRMANGFAWAVSPGGGCIQIYYRLNDVSTHPLVLCALPRV